MEWRSHGVIARVNRSRPLRNLPHRCGKTRWLGAAHTHSGRVQASRKWHAFCRSGQRRRTMETGMGALALAAVARGRSAATVTNISSRRPA